MSKFKFENNAPKARAEFNSKKRLILTAIGEKAVSIWKKIITDKGIVDTGRFRNSAEFKHKSKDSISVGSIVEYATGLEIGTSRMGARPSLKPAILDHKATYKKIAKDILSR